MTSYFTLFFKLAVIIFLLSLFPVMFIQDHGSPEFVVSVFSLGIAFTVAVLAGVAIRVTDGGKPVIEEEKESGEDFTKH